MRISASNLIKSVALLMLLAFCGVVTVTQALVAPRPNSRAKATTCYDTAPRTSDSGEFRSAPKQELSRRNLFGHLLGSTATIWTMAPSLTHAAAAASQETVDKAKIVKGYERLNYLLDNWDKETTVCKGGGDNPYIGCERTPFKVMEYLGYRSTDDPLFKVEKTLMRLAPIVPSEDDADFQNAMEAIVEKADEGSGMAYISSWGEANPGGGKDRVEYFIERSKDNVIVVRDNLKRIIRILDLKA